LDYEHKSTIDKHKQGPRHFFFFFFLLLFLLGMGRPAGTPPGRVPVVVAVSIVGSSPTVDANDRSPTPLPMNGSDMAGLGAAASLAADFADVSRSILISANRVSNFFPSFADEPPPAAPIPSNPSTKRSDSN
jgi:hypothetical protein